MEEIAHQIPKAIKPKPLGWWWPTVLVAIGVLVYYLMLLNFYALPEPLMVRDEVSDLYIE